ncbi:bacterio-opsin activator domain-containing protein [Salinirubrum litoreum]|uniref:Bacterio-opsin activator domain-containing protein n=1 Tax=Salinirubrum litoreum TaxID=1126234 RepID=A0ABD5RGE6_9EURY|nr:bacterio-opsin activator domain-containing protein [Salinirubrum litoreum]
MATIVRGTIPADEFALSRAVTSVPGLELEIERVVDAGGERVMPLLWVRGATRERVESALDADPSTERTELLADLDDEWLYRMEWVDHVELLLRMITTHDATVLDAYGKGDRWQLRVIYPDRDELSAMQAFCTDHGLSFSVESVREMDGVPAGRYGLTTEQFAALTTAAERGLFAVPRRTTLGELAEEFDVSHQAMSERVRRATGALVEDTLLIGMTDDG